MSELLSFEDGIRQRWVKRMTQDIGDLNGKAEANLVAYQQLAIEDPRKAVLQFSTYLQQAREVNPNRAFVEAIAGGPNHEWTAPIIDTVGIVYPELSVAERTQALRQIMEYLDNLRYDYSQNHVERLNEPWLVADILVNSNWHYWPGFRQQAALLAQHKTWEDLYRHLEEVRSAFFMALPVSKPKYASDDIRHNFYATFPTLTDRTHDAIAALIYFRAQNEALAKRGSMEEYIESKLFGYAPEIGPTLLRKMDERKWIDFDDPIHFKDPTSGETLSRRRSELLEEAVS